MVAGSTNTPACPVYWRIQAMVADPSAFTPAAREALETAMKAGQVATLEEMRRFLHQPFGIDYQGVSNLSR